MNILIITSFRSMAMVRLVHAEAHAALHRHVVEAKADQELLPVEEPDLSAVLQHVGRLHRDHLPLVGPSIDRKTDR